MIFATNTENNTPMKQFLTLFILSVLLSSCQKESDFKRYFVGSYHLKEAKANNKLFNRKSAYPVSKVEFFENGLVSLTFEGVPYAGTYTYDEDLQSIPGGEQAITTMVRDVQIHADDPQGNHIYLSWEVNSMTKRKLHIQDITNNYSLVLKRD